MKLIDTVLSIVIVVMNGVYAVWGILIPNSQSKEQWNDYKNKLEFYVNLVSYSDIVVLPLKVLSMIMLKWCCCKCENGLKRGDEEYDVDDVYNQYQIRQLGTNNSNKVITTPYPSSTYMGSNVNSNVNSCANTNTNSYMYCSRKYGVSEFHMNPD